MLPPISELLRRPISPSASPQMASVQGTPMMRTDSKNGYFQSGFNHSDKIFHSADPQLFPESTRTEVASKSDQPLFNSSVESSSRCLELPLPEVSQLPTKLSTRRRKRTPEPSFTRHALEPPNVHPGIFKMAAVDSARWYKDRMAEDDLLWPRKTTRVEGDQEMSEVFTQPEARTAITAVAKRPAQNRSKGSSEVATLKRQRPTKVTNPEDRRVRTRTTPRETVLDTFDANVMQDVTRKETKATRKPSTTPAPAVKKVKAAPTGPDIGYTFYKDYTPDIRGLDGTDNFTQCTWAGKPTDLENDPDKHLLHPKEVKLASKLALSCARYLYLKRRFYLGRLQYARNDQSYNINAAQQKCKGVDEFGLVGADVNKTSSMWKAFNSAGWLKSEHMEPYLDMTD